MPYEDDVPLKLKINIKNLQEEAIKKGENFEPLLGRYMMTVEIVMHSAAYKRFPNDKYF